MILVLGTGGCENSDAPKLMNDLQNFEIPENPSYDQTKLDECEKSIWNTDFIQNLSEEINLKSEGSCRLTSIVLDHQLEENEMIWIKFGEDNGLNFVTYHHFYVYPNQDWAIYYYDPIEDLEMPFITWIEQTKN